MNTITIPKNLINEKDLVILPRKDYETFFRAYLQAKADWIYEKPVSKYIQMRIKNVESEFKKGKAILWQSNKK